MRPRLLLTINRKFAVDFFARSLHTRAAVARLPLRQLCLLVYFVSLTSLFLSLPRISVTHFATPGGAHAFGRPCWCLSISHFLVDTFFELPVVENFAFTITVTVIVSLKAFGWMSQHDLKISPVSK